MADSTFDVNPPSAVIPSQSDAVLTKVLREKLYARYNHRVFVPPDPLQFAYRHADRRDVKIAAFLGVALVCGRVRQIERSRIEPRCCRRAIENVSFLW